MASIPHHSPEARYTATYATFTPPPPVLSHIQLRDVLINAYRHIILHARANSFDKWVTLLHTKLHADQTAFNRDFHAKLYIPTSEWAGNPFLFSLEEVTLRQVYEFYRATKAVIGVEIDSFLKLINATLGFRLDGPDAGTVVQQRLAGMYGKVGEFAPRQF